MAFADYLSRNSSQSPPPPSTDDTQFVIYTINTLNYTLLRDAFDKMNAAKYQTGHDVIKNKARNTQKTKAFCQFRYNNQSLFCNSISQFSIQSYSLHSVRSISNRPKLQKKFVTTRKKPQFETYLQPIIKRKRAPNKSKMASPSKICISISTQTEGSSSKGHGRAPLRDDPDTIIYALGIETNMPQYRKCLTQYSEKSS